MAGGVRETVAREFLRLTAVGVSAEWAIILAVGSRTATTPRPFGAVCPTYARVLAGRAGSRKANCVRWHGHDCGCWGRGSTQVVDNVVDDSVR
jgi:hypothetical protein